MSFFTLFRAETKAGKASALDPQEDTVAPQEETFMKITLLESGELSCDYSAGNVSSFVKILLMLQSGDIFMEIVEGFSRQIEDDEEREVFLNTFVNFDGAPAIRPSEFKI